MVAEMMDTSSAVAAAAAAACREVHPTRGVERKTNMTGVILDAHAREDHVARVRARP